MIHPFFNQALKHIGLVGAGSHFHSLLGRFQSDRIAFMADQDHPQVQVVGFVVGVPLYGLIHGGHSLLEVIELVVTPAQ